MKVSLTIGALLPLATGTETASQHNGEGYWKFHSLYLAPFRIDSDFQSKSKGKICLPEKEVSW